MIDTDKYEGHTPAPWDADDDGAGGNLHIDAEDVRLPINWADTQLMADAPLLLAEVMRLREALITVQQSLVWDEKDRAMDGDPITLEALVAQVEQVRSDITEMIE